MDRAKSNAFLCCLLVVTILLSLDSFWESLSSVCKNAQISVLKLVSDHFTYFTVEASQTTETQDKTSSSRTDKELLRDFDLTLEYGPCIGTDTCHVKWIVIYIYSVAEWLIVHLLASGPWIVLGSNPCFDCQTLTLGWWAQYVVSLLCVCVCVFACVCNE